MSRKSNSVAVKIERHALIFAALGDPMRLTLVSKLIDHEPHSIANLTVGTELTRQAITKHLTVLENVGLVSKVKEGRESLYALDPKPLESIQDYLNVIAKEWDQKLNRLKMFVENT